MITHRHMSRYFKVMQIRMEHQLNRKLQELDLTSAQGHIIGYLAHTPEAPCARDLEQFFGLSHPTVSGLLSRMETKGFIEVRPDEQDRRVKRLFLPEKGMACSRQIQECFEENERQMLQGFTPEETELFRALLSRAVKNMCPEPESFISGRKE